MTGPAADRPASDTRWKPPATANDVRVEETAAGLWRAAALEVVRAAGSAGAERGRFTLALSGGSTPRPLYELLAGDPVLRDALPWETTEVFWSDERCVPPDHPDSNYRMAREALLSRVPLPESSMHRIRAELPDPREAAADYENVLRERFGLPAGGREPPRLDLILLGVGRDGHTASLFQGSPALEERERLVAAARSHPGGAWRVTLTLPVLNAGRHVLFVVHGEDKAEAVRRVLRAREAGPAALVRPARGRLTWLLDRAAASLL